MGKLSGAAAWATGLLVLLGCSTRAPQPFEVDAGTDASSDAKKDGPTGTCTKVNWYPDQDLDGYGAAYDTQFGTAFACDPPSTSTNVKWVNIAGDCADDDATAHPGAVTPRTVPVYGKHPTTPDFDFNCDGKETATYPRNQIASCDFQQNNPPTCALKIGWLQFQDAACGAQGPWATACPSTYPCTQDTGKWTWATVTASCY